MNCALIRPNERALSSGRSRRCRLAWLQFAAEIDGVTQHVDMRARRGAAAGCWSSTPNPGFFAQVRVAHRYRYLSLAQPIQVGLSVPRYATIRPINGIEISTSKQNCPSRSVSKLDPLGRRKPGIGIPSSDHRLGTRVRRSPSTTRANAKDAIPNRSNRRCWSLPVPAD